MVGKMMVQLVVHKLMMVLHHNQLVYQLVVLGHLVQVLGL
jgi:hypothetical protein